MKILIASDSYKDCLSSKEVATCIKEGFKRVFPDAVYERVNLADGGEGTVEAIIDAVHGQIVKCDVLDPLDRKIEAFVGLIDKKTAVVEVASCCGLSLVNELDRDPYKSSSFGFGQLINHALKLGVRKLILGLGGSATNDAGLGMLQALGVRFFDNHNVEISKKRVLNASDLQNITGFDITALEKFKNIEIVVACDVKNPLCGKEGATMTFAAQKGADKRMMISLEENLRHFANLCEKKLAKRTQDIDGAGAAGGIGFALMTFLNTKLQSGIKIVSDLIDLEEKIKYSDLVITGEGRVDAQTIYGKLIMGVARLTKKYDIPVIVIAGSLDAGYEKLYSYGVEAIFDTTLQNVSLEKLFKQSKENLISTSYNVAKLIEMKLD